MPRKLTAEAEAWGRKLWDSALTAPKGVRVVYNTMKDAAQARFILYATRSADKRMNEKLYPLGDLMHGKTSYDSLRVQLFKEKDKEGREIFVLFLSPNANPEELAVSVETI